MTVEASTRATATTATAGEPPTPRGWRYVGAGQRDLRFDLLRGFAVFAMVVDHIGGDSWLYALTGGNRFFVSAAEGFVCISGAIAGIVYGGRARTAGLGAATRQLLARAWLLYVLAVWLALAGALVAWAFNLPWTSPAAATAPARFTLEVIALRRTFYLVDVMLLYAFLLLLTPPALWLLTRGRWWLLLLASWGLWAAYQVSPASLRLPWPIADNPVFHLAAWQVLFFTGLALGYERARLGRIAARFPRPPLRDGGLLALAALFGGLVWLHVTNGAALDRYAPGGDTAALLDRWFDKGALPAARLAAAAVVFACAWALVTRLWRPLHAALGPFLLPLGQGALYAYAAHLFLAAFVHVAIVRASGMSMGTVYPGRLHPGVNALIQLGATLLLWVLTRERFLLPVTAPLGAPPFRRVVSDAGRRAFWRPNESFVVLALVALMAALSGNVMTPQAVAGEGALDDPAAGPKAYSTVTAPRKVGGAARGSTDPLPPPGRVGVVVPTPDPALPATPTPAGGGAAAGYLQDAEFYSDALGRVMSYGIYLPPGYDAATARYPVLYMLHGTGAGYSQWVSFGLAETAENLIEAGQIQPLIIVMPEGDESYWVNHPDGERWADYVAYDLVGHIDGTYRTIRQPGARAIGGLSMGGYGALQLALNNPHIFGAVGAHSPSLRTLSESPVYFGDADDVARHDPLRLATTVDPATAPRVWLDAGQNDGFASRVETLRDALRAQGVRVEYHSWPGEHEDLYWIVHLTDYLRYYDAALRPPARGSNRATGDERRATKVLDDAPRPGYVGTAMRGV